MTSLNGSSLMALYYEILNFTLLNESVHLHMAGIVPSLCELSVGAQQVTNPALCWRLNAAVVVMEWFFNYRRISVKIFYVHL